MTAASQQLHELICGHAIGALDADEARRVDDAIAGDPALADELAALIEAAAAINDGAVVAPDPAVRLRLLDSISREPVRSGATGFLQRFGAAFAAIFDVTVARAQELLALASDPSSWQDGPAPGTWLIHFQAGPACGAADTGFVKCAAGTQFPWHRHLGPEHNLVLAGEADDSRFGRLRPGDETTAEPGSEHEFRVIGDQPFVYAVRVFGVDFNVLRPGA